MTAALPSVTYTFAQLLHGLGIRSVPFRIMDRPAVQCLKCGDISIGKLSGLTAAYGATNTIIVHLPREVLLQVDDLDPTQTAQAVAGSYGQTRPVWIVRTSRLRSQAWYRVPHQPEAAWTQAFCASIGGEANTKPQGALRLPGGINWKDTYGPDFPMVDVTDEFVAAGVLSCPAAVTVPPFAVAPIGRSQRQRRPQSRGAVPALPPWPSPPPHGISYFPRYGPPPERGQRSDWDFHVVARAVGHPQEGHIWRQHAPLLAAWLHAESPKAREKNDGGAYALRTVQAAIARVTSAARPVAVP